MATIAGPSLSATMGAHSRLRDSSQTWSIWGQRGLSSTRVMRTATGPLESRVNGAAGGRHGGAAEGAAVERGSCRYQKAWPGERDPRGGLSGTPEAGAG